MLFIGAPNQLTGWPLCEKGLSTRQNAGRIEKDSFVR